MSSLFEQLITLACPELKVPLMAWKMLKSAAGSASRRKGHIGKHAGFGFDYEIEGVEETCKAIRSLGKGLTEKRPSVTVGYTASYAIFVHEDLEARHENGQAKFLEGPARELANNGELRRVITTAIKKGASLEHALALAAQLIQRESMKLVPVDTGNLRASAFTDVD